VPAAIAVSTQVPAEAPAIVRSAPSSPVAREGSNVTAAQATIPPTSTNATPAAADPRSASHGRGRCAREPVVPVGEDGPVSNAVTAGRLAGNAPSTPEQARATWPRMAGLGVLLTALGVLALTWSGAGPRLLLAALGLLAAVWGATMLRRGRTGSLERAGAVVGASAVWFGVVAAALALLSATAAGWAFVAVLLLALPCLAVAAPGRRGQLLPAAGVVVLAALGLLVFGGVDVLLTTARGTAAVLVALLGLVNVAGAIGMARLARQPAPAPAAGCGGCACGAGGCGSLR
jgi:hypothetical protein